MTWTVSRGEYQDISPTLSRHFGDLPVLFVTAVPLKENFEYADYMQFSFIMIWACLKSSCKSIMHPNLFFNLISSAILYLDFLRMFREYILNKTLTIYNNVNHYLMYIHIQKLQLHTFASTCLQYKAEISSVVLHSSHNMKASYKIQWPLRM